MTPRTKPWFWPGATREDKAKHVARLYRQLAADIAAGRCRIDDVPAQLAALDDDLRERGIYWLANSAPDLLDDPDEWMSAPELAHLLDRSRRDIYNWARLGHIEQRAGADASPEYRVGSVVDYARSLRKRRARNR